MRRAAAAAAALTLLASLALSATPGTAQQRPRARLTLTGQTPFVGAGGDFLLRLRIDRSGLSPTTQVVVTVHRGVATRSEFEQTLQDRVGPAVALPFPYTLGSLAPDSGGDVSIRIPLQDPAQPRDPDRLDLGPDDGVYPVVVELREPGGGSSDRFVTHLVHLPAAHTGPKLGLALVLPIHAALGLPADGPRQLRDVDELTAAVLALEGARGLPFALVPAPETVATLTSLNGDKGARALDALRRLSTDHPVLASPYVPVNVAGLLASGLGEEVSHQLVRGAAVVNDVLRVRPDRRVWIATEPLDPAAVDDLAGRGVERIVASDPVLEPVPELRVTLTRPFLLAGQDSELPAVAADAGLTARFDPALPPALQAQHLLADLAVLWLDSPGARRAAVALPPRTWRASRAFFDALLAGLSQNPILEPIALDSVFSQITPAVAANGFDLVRDPAPPPPPGLGDVVPDVRQARHRLDSLQSVLPAATPASAVLEERLLVAESTELRTARQRQAYLDAVETGIQDHLDAIELPEGRSITLTARRGQIPVTFQNRTGSPVRVVVRVSSDKLEFPEGASRPLELARRNTTERFSVVARTSGAFPLRVTLVSPDGNLVIGRARLTVRSTAASRVSVAVSASAAAFLALWWARHVVRGRRARRLVPS